MAPNADPYRTLGLTRGATLAEVKKAYRRLAKANHPDAAGEAALPRFLAIQAAYDQIVGPTEAGNGTGAGRAAPPRRPWDAEPDRADATRRAYGGRARRTRTSGPRRDAGAGTGAGQAPGGGSTSGAGAGSPGGAPGSGDGDGSPPGGNGNGRPTNKATLGSTSYDGADAEPFEPDWGGASWYGTTSGTYWTLNPKEYADPRKHGPEYQARARRAAAAAARGEAPDDLEEAGPTPTPPLASTEPAPDPAGVPPQPTHTTSSWWDATAGPEPVTATPPGAFDAEADAEAHPGAGADAGGTPEPGASAAGDHATRGAGMAAASAAGWAWLEGDRPAIPGRVGRAVLGWIPIALAIGWAGGELTGCARFSADCDGSTSAVMWLLQVGILVLLVLAPKLASVAAIATVVVIAVAIPAALILSAPGAEGATTSSMTALGILIGVAWIGGLGFGVLRAVRRVPEALS